MTHPFRKQRAIQIDTLARIDRRLAVQRQMVRELRDQHMGQQARASKATLDGAARRSSLCNVVAARACQFRAHMAD